jgi:hypothetical protein
VSILKLLDAMGVPTTLPTGHELGCLCDECHAHRAARQEAIVERIRAGKKPETIMEMLAQRKIIDAVEKGLRALHGRGG